MDLSQLEVLVTLRQDQQALVDASFDAGYVVFRKPKAVVAAKSVEDIVQTVLWANRSGHPIHIRGVGHTQGGQGLVQDGIIVDMRGLDRIGEIEDGTILVQAGVMWRDLVQHVLAQGYIPPALTNNLDTTVGGTLSTGGLGRSTHLYGTQCDNIESLTVVTGTGEPVLCSASENQALFDSTRGGLGQFSVITEARLRLRKAAPKVRTFILQYEDFDVFLADVARLAYRERCTYIRGWFRHRSQDLGQLVHPTPTDSEWSFPLHVSVEFDDIEPRSEEILDGLDYMGPVTALDMTHFQFSDLLEPVPRAATQWAEKSAVAHILSLAQPVTEGFIPWDRISSFAWKLWEHFPPALLSYCNVMLRPMRNDLLRAPMLRAPGGELSMEFGLIPFIPRRVLSTGLKIMEAADRLLVNHDGKRYLTGWTNYGHHEWKEHYGSLWPELLEWKACFDPGHLLNPGYVHFCPDDPQQTDSARQ